MGRVRVEVGAKGAALLGTELQAAELRLRHLVRVRARVRAGVRLGVGVGVGVRVRVGVAGAHVAIAVPLGACRRVARGALGP